MRFTTLRSGVLAPSLAAFALLAGCGSSSYGGGSSTATSAATSQTAAGALGVVRTASSTGLGKSVLVDANGMTLYALGGERPGKLICASNACEQIWRPLTVPSGSAATGSVGALGTVTRPDGARQVTYNGMPLYTFAHDRAPGEANGQGIKDVGTWSAVAVGAGQPNSAQSTHSASSTSSSAGAGAGGYGYGY